MNNHYRLPLDSPRWNQLGTFGVAPERIPLILRKLLEEPVNPADPILNELMNAIFHQYSLADATYFVLPYLTDIHARYADTNPRLFYLAANIAASAKIVQIDLPPEFRQAFLETLIDFESIAISNIVTKDQPFLDVYNACKAAMAFSRHCCGKLLMDVLEQEGTKRTSLICPQCQQGIRIMLFQAGAVIIERGEDPQPPEPPRPLAQPHIRPHVEREPNPWRVVERFLTQDPDSAAISETEGQHLEIAARLCALGFGPNVPPEGAFTLIGSIMLKHGFASSARRFFRLWDTVNCPKCNSPFVAATGWWGCVI